MPATSTLRADLLTLAHETLAERGYGALSVRGLARGLGVTPGAIYYHFDGKAGIYQAVVADGLAAIRDRVRAAYASTSDPAARVRAMAEAYCAFGLENPHTYYVIMMLREEGQPDVSDEQKQPGRDVIGMTAMALGELVATDGAPIPDDPEMLALETWSILHGALALVVSERMALTYPGFDVTRLTSAAVDRVLGMIERGG